MHKCVLALVVVASPFSAFAAELPKEGSYDFNSCWSGVNNTITFSKTHTASSFEMTGTTRSNPPGGIFDKSTFRCVGMNASLDGKVTGSNVCETIDADGDKFDHWQLAQVVAVVLCEVEAVEHHSMTGAPGAQCMEVRPPVIADNYRLTVEHE
jgi:hypothetical protein